MSLMKHYSCLIYGDLRLPETKRDQNYLNINLEIHNVKLGIFEIFWVLSLKEVALKCTKESLLTVFVPYVMRTKASDQWRASQGVTNVVFEQRMGSNWDSNLFQCQKVLMLQRMVLPYPLPSSRLSAGGPPTFIGESPSVF